MADVRPRLVFASRRPPWPQDNGARIRTNRLLRGLSESFETTFVTFEHAPGSPDGHMSAQDLRELFRGVEVVTVPGLGAAKRIGQAASLARARSWAFGRYRRRAMAQALTAAVTRHRPCVAHYDDLGMAGLGPLAGAVNVYCSHNVEQRIAQLDARHGSPVRRAFSALEARRIAREEERAWRTMDLSLAVSEVDAELMRAGGVRRVELCPNGADPVDMLPEPRRGRDEPLRILFVGSGGYLPYERGLAWLVHDVLPRVRETVPVVFDVVGQPPARPVSAEGVRYMGRVPSVEPWYAGAHAVVVPVFQGSGTRLKMIEAMAYGRPVVSTRLGAEGLPVVAGQNYLAADDADAFANALLSLADMAAGGDGRLTAMLARARETAEPLMWPAITRRLIDLYESELRRLAGAPAPAGG
jgi:glycosyltransferase involved in cell wall biosynthesis